LFIQTSIAQNISKLFKNVIFSFTDDVETLNICPDAHSNIIASKYVLDQNPFLIANGCGPVDFSINEPYGFYKCCNGHDLCYSICGTDFTFCENYFSSCLQHVCDEQKTNELKGNCSETADVFTFLTQNFGASFHYFAQKESCECFSTEVEAKEQYKRIFNDFFERHSDIYDIYITQDILTEYDNRKSELEFKIVREFGKSFVQFDNIEQKIY
jgi:secretory phospholipase A2